MHNLKYLLFFYFYCVLIPLSHDQKNERAKINSEAVVYLSSRTAKPLLRRTSSLDKFLLLRQSAF